MAIVGGVDPNLGGIQDRAPEGPVDQPGLPRFGRVLAAAWEAEVATCLTLGKMTDAMLDTAQQRGATGLDQGARKLIVKVVVDVAGVGPDQIVKNFFEDRFGGFDDYFAAVGEVWGETVGYRLRQLVQEASANAEFPLGFNTRKIDAGLARTYALLLHAPEPDFRHSVSLVLQATRRTDLGAERITQICRNRGVPWAFADPDGFEYVGDEEVERELIRPALAAINRPEFAGGVRQEFESARAELGRGTPDALKQAIHEAGCSLESAMKVLLDTHGQTYGQGDTASPLFDHLEAAGIVPRHMQNLVLVAMTPRNRRGGHGAGAQPHQVDVSEAEAIVAGTAGAIAYLASRLP